MGMTKTSELFDRLSKSDNMETVIMAEAAQNLYLGVLKGNIGAGEIQTYIQENCDISRVPEADRKDYAKLLELISMLGSAQ